jgi:hypothetical protein
MSRRARNPRDEQRLQDRLTALGRASLGAAGFNDETIRAAYRTLAEALGAVRVKDFQFRGEVISGPDRVDHEARLRAVELITKLADHHPMSRVDVELGGRTMTDAERLEALAMLGPDLRGVGAASTIADEPATADLSRQLGPTTT